MNLRKSRIPKYEQSVQCTLKPKHQCCAAVQPVETTSRDCCRTCRDWDFCRNPSETCKNCKGFVGTRLKRVGTVGAVKTRDQSSKSFKLFTAPTVPTRFGTVPTKVPTAPTCSATVFGDSLYSQHFTSKLHFGIKSQTEEFQNLVPSHLVVTEPAQQRKRKLDHNRRYSCHEKVRLISEIVGLFV